jgi:hypothetical protein
VDELGLTKKVNSNWLMLAILDELDADIGHLKSERQWVSTLGDEILDFYQPDEDLKVEDIVPDTSGKANLEMKSALEFARDFVRKKLAESGGTAEDAA